MSKQLLVLDLSYFRGASARSLENLFVDHEVAVTMEFFAELLDSDEEARQSLRSKLPLLDSPGPLLPEVGHLLYLENVERKPSAPLQRRTLSRRFKVNDRLFDPGLELPVDQQAAFEKWKRYSEECTHGFHDNASCVTGWFPELKGFRANGDPTLICKHQKLVAQDVEAVRQIYGQIRTDNAPPAAIVGRTWAHLRHVQVRLVAALEYLRVHGDGVIASTDAKTVNQWLDINHVILGLLAGGIATRDKFIQRTFKFLNPDGILIS